MHPLIHPFLLPCEFFSCLDHHVFYGLVYSFYFLHYNVDSFRVDALLYYIYSVCNAFSCITKHSSINACWIICCLEVWVRISLLSIQMNVSSCSLFYQILWMNHNVANIIPTDSLWLLNAKETDVLGQEFTSSLHCDITGTQCLDFQSTFHQPEGLQFVSCSSQMPKLEPNFHCDNVCGALKR